MVFDTTLQRHVCQCIVAWRPLLSVLAMVHCGATLYQVFRACPGQSFSGCGGVSLLVAPLADPPSCPSPMSCRVTSSHQRNWIVSLQSPPSADTTYTDCGGLDHGQQPSPTVHASAPSAVSQLPKTSRFQIRVWSVGHLVGIVFVDLLLVILCVNVGPYRLS